MSHIRYTSIPPLRNLLREAEIDAHIAEGRDAYDDAFAEFEHWQARRIERRAKPSVIETRPSLWARAIRYGRSLAAILNLAVKGFSSAKAAPTNKADRG